eukprot:6200055-Pleurochrysis_carterae.AAC.4
MAGRVHREKVRTGRIARWVQWLASARARALAHGEGRLKQRAACSLRLPPFCFLLDLSLRTQAIDRRSASSSCFRRARAASASTWRQPTRCGRHALALLDALHFLSLRSLSSRTACLDPGDHLRLGLESAQRHPGAQPGASAGTSQQGARGCQRSDQSSGRITRVVWRLCSVRWPPVFYSVRTEVWSASAFSPAAVLPVLHLEEPRARFAIAPSSRAGDDLLHAQVHRNVCVRTGAHAYS